MIPGLVALIVIGAAAGFVATRLMNVQADLPTAMGLGVIGALVGGFALRLISSVGGWFVTFLIALGGAMALVWLWRRFGR